MAVTETNSSAWNDKLLENPHVVADKRARVQKMFAAIAPSYDLNNRVHSLWRDQAWRKKAVKLSSLKPTDRVVDVACGTGDLTHAYFIDCWSARGSHRRNPVRFSIDAWIPPKGQIIGLDFTLPMLQIAKRKRIRLGPGPLTLEDEINASASNITWTNGDALALPLPEQSADVVSIAFGIRNVSDPAAAIREFHRVLRPGGRVIVLEFSLPTNAVMRGLYNFYFRKILPRTATLISGDKTGAYKYLPESVNTFIGREQMMGMMREAGFVDVEQFPMTFGVCVCYRGVKR